MSLQWYLHERNGIVHSEIEFSWTLLRRKWEFYQILLIDDQKPNVTYLRPHPAPKNVTTYAIVDAPVCMWSVANQHFDVANLLQKIRSHPKFMARKICLHKFHKLWLTFLYHAWKSTVLINISKLVIYWKYFLFVFYASFLLFPHTFSIPFSWIFLSILCFILQMFNSM